MTNLHIVFSMVKNHFRKWTVNPRIYLIIIGFILYFYVRLQPVNAFCADTGYHITPYIFPFIMSEPFSVMLIMLGVVFLFCDAPFIENEQPYVILRSNRTLWAAAQITYIAIACLLYFLFILLLSIVLLLPNLEFSFSWGKVIGSFSQTSLAPQHGIFLNFDYKIMHAFTPMAAMGISFLQSLTVSVFIGLCLFTLNMNITRAAGNIISSVFIFIHTAVSGELPGFIWFSPVSWVSLSNINLKENTLYPPLSFIFAFLMVLIIVLSVVIIWTAKKKDIEVAKSI